MLAPHPQEHDRALFPDPFFREAVGPGLANELRKEMTTTF